MNDCYKKDKQEVYPGQKIGRWTVLDAQMKNERGETKQLCRCECGTERYVLKRSLLYGGTMSCGCLRKEAARKAISLDLTGQTFGELTVIRESEKKHKKNGVWWICKCSCGEEYEVLGTLLMTGRKQHCTSQAHERNYVYADIRGERFGRLTALYPSRRYDKSGSVIWRCRCDCGNEVDISYNVLKYTKTKSCGCQKKEHDQKLKTFLTHVAGTSVDMLKSKKIPADNTSGYKGVYIIRGKYVAKIVFQNKAYYLGTYDDIQDAVAARKEAEVILFDRVAEHYQKWKYCAEKNPVWAEENPVRVIVERNTDRKLLVTCLPEL